MSQTPDQFIAVNDGKLINNGGIQCGAVFNQQNRDVVEGGWIGTPITGYVIDIWTQFGTDVDYNNYIRVGANEPAQKGDSAIWTKYNGNGLPHVAYVIEDLGDRIKCLTQNPGAAHKEVLTKKGLAGYLRPKKFIKVAPVPTISQTPTAKPIDEAIIVAAMRGDYGNDPQRSANLRAAGYDPVAIQAAINARMASPAPASAPVNGHTDNGATFTVGHPTPGYVTAKDAMAGTGSNSVVPVGTFAIFNRANGAVNVTRIAGQPGWWMNPNV